MPVYNSESTLRRSIESFIAQTYPNWELIIVNDGSIDNSADIIKEYKLKDSRVKAINKSNGGVASARQAGMDHMTGMYFIHADSDDWVEPQMLEEMMDIALQERADILIADYFVDYLNGKCELIRQNPKSFDPGDILYSIYAKDLFGGLCHKLILKSAYDKAQARFINGINYCEDVILLTQILKLKDLKISYLDKAYYHYILSEQSLTRNISKRSFESLKKFTKLLPDILPKEERYRGVIEKGRLDLFIAGFVNRMYDSKEQKEEYRKVKDMALSTPSLRWKIGYYCIELGLNKIAHKLIRF